MVCLEARKGYLSLQFLKNIYNPSTQKIYAAIAQLD